MLYLEFIVSLCCRPLLSDLFSISLLFFFCYFSLTEMVLHSGQGIVLPIDEPKLMQKMSLKLLASCIWRAKTECELFLITQKLVEISSNPPHLTDFANNITAYFFGTFL